MSQSQAFALKVLAVVVVLVFLVLVAIGSPPLEALSLAGDAPRKVWQALTALLLVTLTFERALEVYVAAFREDREVPLQREVDDWQAKVDALAKDTSLQPGDKAQRTADLAQVGAQPRQRLEAFKNETRQITMGMSLVGGIVVSAAGFRVLAEVLAAAPPSGFQGAAFGVLDVIVTGGLIAGGSKGLHVLTQAVGDVLEETSKRSIGH